MGFKDSGAAAFGTLLAALVDEAASGACGPADLDLVLLTCGRTVGVEAAALANRKEEVVVVAILSDERSLLLREC